MKKNEKFMFKVSFDEPYKKPEEEAPPPPTFTEEELAHAKTEAYQKGRTDGIQETQDSLHATMDKVLATFAPKLESIFAHYQADIEDVAENTLISTKAIVEKLFPHYAQTHGFAEVEAMVQKSLDIIIHKPAVTIQVHPDLVALLEEKIKNIPPLTNMEGDIVVKENTNLGISDCEIKWGKEGGTQRHATELFAEIQSLVDAQLKEPVPLQKPADPSAVPEEEVTDTKENAPIEESKVETSEDSS